MDYSMIVFYAMTIVIFGITILDEKISENKKSKTK
jgi:hypothetical protein